MSTRGIKSFVYECVRGWYVCARAIRAREGERKRWSYFIGRYGVAFPPLHAILDQKLSHTKLLLAIQCCSID